MKWDCVSKESECVVDADGWDDARALAAESLGVKASDVSATPREIVKRKPPRTSEELAINVEEARASLAACTDVSRVKDILDKAKAIASYQRAKAGGEEAVLDANEIVVWCVHRIGELEREMPKATGPGRGKKTAAHMAAISNGPETLESRYGNKNKGQRLSSVAQTVARIPTDELAKKLAAGRAKRRLPTLSRLVTEVRNEEATKNLTNISAVKAKAVKGLYDVIVLDPPWYMKKIERDVRPNQTAFDYPPMNEAELAAIKVNDELGPGELPCAVDCHIWVWTTQKHLPMALRLLDAWRLKYVCTFVWHKPGGFQPIGLPQYNCEFALYARRGSPRFVDTKALPVCFSAKRGEHSEKPEEFYEVLRRVTAGRRLDMFARRPIDGFDRWGNQA